MIHLQKVLKSLIYLPCLDMFFDDLSPFFKYIIIFFPFSQLNRQQIYLNSVRVLIVATYSPLSVHIISVFCWIILSPVVLITSYRHSHFKKMCSTPLALIRTELKKISNKCPNKHWCTKKKRKLYFYDSEYIIQIWIW